MTLGSPSHVVSLDFSWPAEPVPVAAASSSGRLLGGHGFFLLRGTKHKNADGLIIFPGLGVFLVFFRNGYLFLFSSFSSCSGPGIFIRFGLFLSSVRRKRVFRKCLFFFATGSRCSPPSVSSAHGRQFHAGEAASPGGFLRMTAPSCPGSFTQVGISPYSEGQKLFCRVSPPDFSLLAFWTFFMPSRGFSSFSVYHVAPGDPTPRIMVVRPSVGPVRCLSPTLRPFISSAFPVPDWFITFTHLSFFSTEKPDLAR